MSVEDKIRRAEEIYYKRRMGEVSNKNINIEPEKDWRRENLSIERRLKRKSEKNIKLLKRLTKQIIVCMIIYGIFYITVNNNYVFSEDFANKAKEILNQDIDLKSIYITGMSKIKEWSEQLNKQTEENNPIPKEENQEQDVNNAGNEKNEENNISAENQNSEVDKIDEGDEAIGGGNDENENVENTNENSESTQMEQDANYIKNAINFIKPINGKITSGFGQRNPTTTTVPKNHTGTDIAAKKGTKIISSTEGTVILASSTGDYGKHLKIQTNDKDIIVVYAHCNNLYVNEGESIKQGQEIAEVGSTGNATGPHLHFEIRYQERYVDPQLILEL